MEQVHATCVVVDGGGVLIRGLSGAGKSDLALRLIDEGGRLVADDRVDLSRRDEFLMASVPPQIAGRLEVRGLGIIDVDWLPESRINLVIDLTPTDEVERYPDVRQVTLEGVTLRCVSLSPFDVSATAKVRMAVRRAQNEV